MPSCRVQSIKSDKHLNHQAAQAIILVLVMENMFLKIEVVSEINECFFEHSSLCTRPKIGRGSEALRGVEEATIRPRRTRRTISLSMVLHTHRKKCKAIISLLLAFYTDAQLCWQAPGIVLTCHADNLLWVSHLFELYHFFKRELKLLALLHL